MATKESLSLPIRINVERISRKKMLLGIAIAFTCSALGGSMSSAELRKVTTVRTSAENAVDQNVARFEVVSIRPSKTGGTSVSFDVTPSGLVATNITLEEITKQAFFPQWGWYWPKERGVLNAPQWLGEERYTIQAKVSPATAERWRKIAYPQLLQQIKPALQVLLSERCKLVLHKITEDRPIWALVTKKQRPKLVKTDPSKAPPAHAMVLAEGGVMVAGGHGDTQTLSFFGAPMESLAEVLTRSSSRLVFDRTGLRDRYDFVLAKRELGPSSENAIGSSVQNSMLSTNWDLDALGLELKSATAPTQILVVDHIERPSEN